MEETRNWMNNLTPSIKTLMEEVVPRSCVCNQQCLNCASSSRKTILNILDCHPELVFKAMQERARDGGTS